MKDKYLLKIIKKKQTNLILSLDVQDRYRFFAILLKCKDHICGVKVHSDMLDFADDDFYKRLNELSKAHNFIIIEDRKLADIGYINRLQANCYKNKGIDYMTCHCFMGEDAVNSISDMKLFLISDMSCKDCMLSDDLDKISSELYDSNDNVIGFVSQKDKEKGFVLRPGIKLSEGTDDFGQVYKKPKVSKGVLWVVGRGITKAKDPATVAEKYKKIFKSQISAWDL